MTGTLQSLDTSKLTTLLNDLRKNADAGPFLRPVEWKRMELFDYPKIITRPMDLRTVGRKLRDNVYNTTKEVLDEIQLIWDNCKTYNDEATEVYAMAVSMEKDFNALIIKHSLSTGSDANDVNEKQTGASSSRRSRRLSYEEETPQQQSDITVNETAVSLGPSSVSKESVKQNQSTSGNITCSVNNTSTPTDNNAGPVTTGLSNGIPFKRGPGRPPKRLKMQMVEFEDMEQKKRELGYLMRMLSEDSLGKFLRIVETETIEPEKKLLVDSSDPRKVLFAINSFSPEEISKMHSILKCMAVAETKSKQLFVSST